MKFSILFFAGLLAFQSSTSQVSLQTGSPQINIPLYSYNNSNSNLGFSLSLNYSGGNGIKVNDEASEVGLGWTLTTGGQVIRMKNDEADDQVATAAPGDLKIKAGIFNAPTSPTFYDVLKNAWSPTYPDEDAYKKTYYDPLVHYDKEHDEFAFSFNGRSGKFILGTDIAHTPLLFENSAIKVRMISGNSILTSIGSIGGFVITDENGIEYKFMNPLYSRVMEYVKSCYVKHELLNYVLKCDDPANPPRNNIPADPAFMSEEKQFEIYVPKETAYHIANLWNISEITNPQTNEKITFNYDNLEYKSNIDFSASSNISEEVSFIPSPSPVKRYTINISENYESYVYPQLRSVEVNGNKKVEFSYSTVRKDQVGKKALDEILYYEDGIVVSKHKLSYGYFYKSSILNEIDLPGGYRSKDVALCLKSINKVGSDNVADQPTKFDYYTGISNDPNITFRERFNLSQDHWGYNNYDGGFSASATNYGSSISISSLYEYLQHPEIHRVPSSNIELLQVGMIKQMTNPYGGVTKYSYEPNQAYFNGTNVLSGGLRVKEISAIDNQFASERKIKYQYILANGNSSGYGYEAPNYDELNTATWIVPNGNGINYNGYVSQAKNFAKSFLTNLTSLNSGK